MLPMLGMLVAGYMSKQGAAAPAASQSARAGGLGAMLGSLAGTQAGERSAGGGIAGLLDLDGDGNPLNDVIGMLGKLRR